MRVLFALESYLPHYGGEEVRVHSLATRLPSDWEVHVVSPRFDNSASEELDGRVQVHRLGRFNSSDYFRENDRPLLTSLNYGMLLRRFVSRHEDFDVVQFGQWNMLHYILAGGRLECPKIVDWCEVLSGELSGVKGRGESVLEWGLTRGVDHHLATNDFNKAKLSRVHRIPQEEISVVENGVSEDGLVSSSPKKDPDRVLYVGRLAPHKQIDLLIGAIRSLQKNMDLQLRVVGSGPEAYVRSLKAESDESVTFLGTVSDAELKEEYSRAKVLVLPSRREGSSLVSLEAMASWTPVITVGATLNYSTQDVIKDRFNGLVVDDSVDGIAGGLSRTLGESELYERLSLNAFETARGRTWNRIASKLESILESVAQGEAPDVHVESRPLVPEAGGPN